MRWSGIWLCTRDGWLKTDPLTKVSVALYNSSLVLICDAKTWSPKNRINCFGHWTVFIRWSGVWPCTRGGWLKAGLVFPFITPILKSLIVLVIWLALIGAIYSRIAPFFVLNHIFFPANEEASLKTKQPIRFQGLFKVTDQIAGKWKTKSIMWQILQLLFPKLLFFPLKNGWI